MREGAVSFPVRAIVDHSSLTPVYPSAHSGRLNLRAYAHPKRAHCSNREAKLALQPALSVCRHHGSLSSNSSISMFYALCSLSRTSHMDKNIEQAQQETYSFGNHYVHFTSPPTEFCNAWTFSHSAKSPSQ